ncbi:DUF1642 domain-containing protein [Lactococcus lactis]|uniref:DUF1642 domain-containing protein n=1 Tax=Lactococcus lactis TaxID=1358 RepID=UPI00288F5923|nr:DUF1642 domain-containing protein [Lactococcus lactis]MDT2919314.1 DUF1642 domain-containing protein [Lactococcus lactis]
MTKFEEKLMATAKMIPTSDGNEIKFKPYSALYDYLLVSNGEAELYLQQQALPVVPDFVAEYIERCKRSDCGLIWAIRPDRDANDNSEKVYDWLFPNGVDYLARPDKENQIKFVRAWLDGYQVEKPQLFYLKAKELLVVGDYDHVEDLWLDWNKNLTPKKQDAHQFTQKELDSFYSKKYEQVEVTE